MIDRWINILNANVEYGMMTVEYGKMLNMLNMLNILNANISRDDSSNGSIR